MIKNRSIRILDTLTANQIAAGEVIERPAAVVKELVENAIDADALHIHIRIKDGGRTLIEVSDDGCGIAREDLALALMRHATSKLPENDLSLIHSFGFRGEALPSIGAVARLEMASRAQDEDEAWALDVEAGKIAAPYPTRHKTGTTIRVRDLFFATPARLKFLSSDRAEWLAIVEVVKRLAMACPNVGFTLADLTETRERVVLDVRAQGESGHRPRLEAVLSESDLGNALEIEAAHQDIRLEGFVGLPTNARGSAQAQYFFVNGRPVRDKIFLSAVKGAYADVLPPGKFPFVALYLTVPPQSLDVNVHPAKTEIRFRRAGDVRSFIFNAIRYRLTASSVQRNAVLGARLGAGFYDRDSSPSLMRGFAEPVHSFSLPRSYASGLGMPVSALENEALGGPSLAEPDAPASTEDMIPPLGYARAQIHGNYILSETPQGLVIIDAHAAHERLVYEKLKTQYAQKQLLGQRLLIPEVMTLGPLEKESLLEVRTLLGEMGLEIEPFGKDAIIVNMVPALLAQTAPQKLVQDVIGTLADDPKSALETRINHILATMACHGSVRTGRRLNLEEMNALLREIELTPNAATCNHGRPTYIMLDLSFLEARFGR